MIKDEYPIRLGKAEIKKVADFADEICKPKHDKTSGNFASANHRHDTKRKKDWMTGKLGEMAFAKHMTETYGIVIEVDFDIVTGRKNVDHGQDIVSVNGQKTNFRFDIKTTGRLSQWLLVEGHKMDDHVISSHVYILMRGDYLEKNGVDENADTVGFSRPLVATRPDFFHGIDLPYFPYVAGERLLRDRPSKAVPNGLSRKFEFLQDARNADMSDIPDLGPRLESPTNLGLPIRVLEHRSQNKEEFLAKSIKRNSIPVLMAEDKIFTPGCCGFKPDSICCWDMTANPGMTGITDAPKNLTWKYPTMENVSSTNTMEKFFMRFKHPGKGIKDR